MPILSSHPLAAITADSIKQAAHWGWADRHWPRDFMPDVLPPRDFMPDVLPIPETLRQMSFPLKPSSLGKQASVVYMIKHLLCSTVAWTEIWNKPIFDATSGWTILITQKPVTVPPLFPPGNLCSSFCIFLENHAFLSKTDVVHATLHTHGCSHSSCSLTKTETNKQRNDTFYRRHNLASYR